MNHLRKSLICGLSLALSAGFLPIHVLAEDTENEPDVTVEETAEDPSEAIEEESAEPELIIEEAEEIPDGQSAEAISSEPEAFEEETVIEPWEKDESENEIFPEEKIEKEPLIASPMGSGEFDDAAVIHPDEDVSAYILTGGKFFYYRFIPTESAYYTLSSDVPENGADTYANLYKPDGTLIKSDDDSGKNMNFRLVAWLEKGTTYYYGVRFYHESDTGQIPLRLIKGGAVFDSYGSVYYLVNPGGSAALQVSVFGDTSRTTYQWYRNNTVLSSEKSSVLNLGNLNYSYGYYCHCDDGFGFSEDVFFQVDIENHFSLSRVGDYDITAAYNSSQKLEFNISADNTSGMKIEWYEYVFNKTLGYTEEKLISGANGLSYTISKVTHTAEYCAVVTDRYGNVRRIDYYVRIPNELSADCVGDYEHRVTYNGSVTLKVKVSANDLTGMKYSWYAFDPHPASSSPNTWLEDSPALTLENVKNNLYLLCVVRDRYENMQYVYYYVSIDNKLSAEVIGGSIISVLLYGAVTVNLKVNALDKTGLVFEWYTSSYDYDVENFVDTLIARNSSSSYTIGNIQKPTPGKVIVYDRFGNSVTVEFGINIIEDYQIAVRKDFLFLEVGKSETLIADGEPHKNWSSLYPEVASVDQNGKVTVKKVGWTQIYCYDDNNVYGDSCFVRGVFSDVKTRSAFYFDPVYWAFDKKITTGTSDTTFSPNDKCSRAQIVTFLWRFKGSPKVDYNVNFTDVSKDKYYYDAVAWAAYNGITTGTSDTTFSPNDKCTRGQIVTFLYRAMGEPSPGAAVNFTDVSSDKYYYKAVCWAANNNITTGTSDTTFSPGDKCTRAQSVTFLYRTAILPQ